MPENKIDFGSDARAAAPTTNELVTAAIAHEIRDGDLAFVGVGTNGRAFTLAVGIPLAAVRLAQMTHAPGASVYWGNLLEPDLLSDPRFATLEARMAHLEAIEAIVADWVASKTADEVVALLRQAELPGARIATLADVVSNPHLRAARQIVEVEHPTAGPVTMQGVTVALGGSPGSIRRAAPLLGEHTGAVMAEWLGLTETDVAALRKDGTL